MVKVFLGLLLFSTAYAGNLPSSLFHIGQLKHHFDFAFQIFSYDESSDLFNIVDEILDTKFIIERLTSTSEPGMPRVFWTVDQKKKLRASGGYFKLSLLKGMSVQAIVEKGETSIFAATNGGNIYSLDHRPGSKQMELYFDGTSIAQYGEIKDLKFSGKNILLALTDSHLLVFDNSGTTLILEKAVDLPHSKVRKTVIEMVVSKDRREAMVLAFHPDDGLVLEQVYFGIGAPKTYPEISVVTSLGSTVPLESYTKQFALIDWDKKDKVWYRKSADLLSIEMDKSRTPTLEKQNFFDHNRLNLTGHIQRLIIDYPQSGAYFLPRQGGKQTTTSGSLTMVPQAAKPAGGTVAQKPSASTSVSGDPKTVNDFIAYIKNKFPKLTDEEIAAEWANVASSSALHYFLGEITDSDCQKIGIQKDPKRRGYFFAPDKNKKIPLKEVAEVFSVAKKRDDDKRCQKPLVPRI